ncbi:MAG: helix-turn-helix transcriptional regulator [Clostridiales bacterium]|nr:helix-turn-helix transcriptional regulator [Clostridiales bacterium]
MSMTIGRRISMLRKEKGITQEGLASKVGVSPQAVSKWENDISYPDIQLLPILAEILGVSVDELLSGQDKKIVEVVPPEKRKNVDDMMLRIVVNSADGDKVRVNLPMSLVKLGLELGMEMPQVSGNDSLKGVDFEKIMELVDKGLVGKLVEVESADGDIIEIEVE